MGDPEKTHEQTLELLSNMTAFEGVLKRIFSVQDARLQVRLGSLTFPNPVGPTSVAAPVALFIV